jgi:hypothetical protein
VWQEFFEPPDRMFRDAPEHIAEPDKRIDPDEFAGGYEAPQDSGSPAAVVASEKNPVISTHCEAAQRPLGAVIVNRQIAIGTVSCQSGPVLQRVGPACVPPASSPGGSGSSQELFPGWSARNRPRGSKVACRPS